MCAAAECTGGVADALVYARRSGAVFGAIEPGSSILGLESTAIEVLRADLPMKPQVMVLQTLVTP